MHPAIAFTEAVCKRAREDGWILMRNPTMFMWKRGNEQLGAQAIFMDEKEQLFQACVELDKAHYNLRVELDS